MKQKSKKLNKVIAPICGSFPIFTKGNLKISNGYEQINLSKIPFLEILPKNLVFDNIEIPFHQRWRKDSNQSNYVEYRSKDYCKTKIIFDKNKNKFYVSAFEVTSSQYPIIVRKGKK